VLDPGRCPASGRVNCPRGLSVERSVADVGAEDNPLDSESRFFIQDMTKGGSDRKIGLSVAMTDKVLAYMEEFDIGPDDLHFPLSRLKAEHDKATVVPLAVIGEIPDDLDRTPANRLGRTYRHGTMSAYTAGACKCDWCRRAFALYRAQRRAEGKDLHPRKEGRKVGKNLADHCTDDWFRREVWKAALEAAKIRRRIVFYDLRRTHATWLGVPAKLMDERLGHADGSVQARYSHVTPEMRRRLLYGLTGLWSAALERRRAINVGSPVSVDGVS
jgi:hypothetical protein